MNSATMPIAGAAPMAWAVQPNDRKPLPTSRGPQGTQEQYRARGAGR